MIWHYWPLPPYWCLELIESSCVIPWDLNLENVLWNAVWSHFFQYQNLFFRPCTIRHKTCFGFSSFWFENNVKNLAHKFLPWFSINWNNSSELTRSELQRNPILVIIVLSLKIDIAGGDVVNESKSWSESVRPLSETTHIIDFHNRSFVLNGVFPTTSSQRGCCKRLLPADPRFEGTPRTRWLLLGSSTSLLSRYQSTVGCTYVGTKRLSQLVSEWVSEWYLLHRHISTLAILALSTTHKCTMKSVKQK